MRWFLLSLICVTLTLSVPGCGADTSAKQLPVSGESLNEDGEEKSEMEE